MTDETLLDYLLGVLETSDREAVDRLLEEDAALRGRMIALQFTVSVLERDLSPIAIPIGLAERTLAYCTSSNEWERGNSARTQSSTLPTLRPDYVHSRFRGDWIVASGIAFLVIGLTFAGVSRLRYSYQLASCQNNLRVLYLGLSGYADLNDDRFPQVGLGNRATAGTFVQTLEEAGQCPINFMAVCPACTESDAPTAGYTYSLGYRSADGELLGLRRGLSTVDTMPISADYPTADCSPESGPVSPHFRVMNVLLVGGKVHTTTTAHVGSDGDDIYRNREGRIAAGLDRMDTVLGRVDDRP